MANMTQDQLILIVISVIWACHWYCWQGTKHRKTMPTFKGCGKTSGLPWKCGYGLHGRHGHGQHWSESVYTGCSCWLPHFEVKNRTRLDFKTLPPPSVQGHHASHQPNSWSKYHSIFGSLTSRPENLQVASPNQPIWGSVMQAQKGLGFGTQH